MKVPIPEIKPLEPIDHNSDTLDVAYQKWIRIQMDKRVLDYSEIEKLSIKCASWNISAHSLEDADIKDLKAWLLPSNNTSSVITNIKAPDVYVIGLQEVVDLNVRNTFFNNTTRTDTTSKCIHILSQVLNEVEYYKILLDRTMVGIVMVVFVRDELYEHVQEVGFSMTFNGALGMAGNKGGIAIRMLIYDSPICFICAHLAANRECVSARNLDYKAIIDNDEFTIVTPVIVSSPTESDEITYKDIRASIQEPILSQSQDDSNTDRLSSTTSSGQVQKRQSVNIISPSRKNNKFNSGPRYSKAGLLPITGVGIPKNIRVLSHDYVFFIGDLNYRIDECIDAHLVHQALSGGNNPKSNKSNTSLPLPPPPVSVINSTSSSTIPSTMTSSSLPSIAEVIETTAIEGIVNNPSSSTTSSPSPSRSNSSSDTTMLQKQVQKQPGGGGDANNMAIECETNEVLDTTSMESITRKNRYFLWLLEFDQLNMERVKETVFQEFHEGTITFRPTYKYIAGTHNYDIKRVPAWCDRILWWTNEALRHTKTKEKQTSTTTANTQQFKGALNDNILANNNHNHTNIESTNIGVNQLYYACTQTMLLSDHKPISALFECSALKVQKTKMLQVYQELLVTVDKWINDSAPKANIEGRMIDFAPFYYNIPQKAKMVVHNTGSVMMQWKFVPKHEELFICKPWLHLSVREGILAPDEKMDIIVSIDLSLKEACKIAYEHDNMLEDILILRIVHGNDFFCIINGSLDIECANYLRTNYSSGDGEKTVTIDQFYVDKTQEN